MGRIEGGRYTKDPKAGNESRKIKLPISRPICIAERSNCQQKNALERVEFDSVYDKDIIQKQEDHRGTSEPQEATNGIVISKLLEDPNWRRQNFSGNLFAPQLVCGNAKP